LQTAFEKRYVKPAALRFRSACKVFEKKQKTGESVDAYADRMRRQEKKISMDNSTLLYAFVLSLRLKIANFVLGRNSDHINAVIDDAKIGKLSTDKGTTVNNMAITYQLAKMRKDIQRMAQNMTQ